MGPRCVAWREQFTVWCGGGQGEKRGVRGWSAARRKSKDLTQRSQRKGGEKSEKDGGVNGRDGEGAEKVKGFGIEKAGEILRPPRRAQDDGLKREHRQDCLCHGS